MVEKQSKPYSWLHWHNLSWSMIFAVLIRGTFLARYQIRDKIPSNVNTWPRDVTSTSWWTSKFQKLRKSKFHIDLFLQVLLTTNLHWVRYWRGAWWNQAIIITNDDEVIWRHMARFNLRWFERRNRPNMSVTISKNISSNHSSGWDMDTPTSV